MTAPFLDRISTARLQGRRIVLADLDHLHAVYSDPEVQRGLYGELPTREQTAARLDRWLKIWADHGYGFWVFRDASGADVAHGGLFPSPHAAGCVELGYIVTPSAWGNGYATEITGALLDVAFAILKLDRVVANTGPGNAASRRVLEKNGFRLERESLYKGEWPNLEFERDRAGWDSARSTS